MCGSQGVRLGSGKREQRAAGARVLSRLGVGSRGQGVLQAAEARGGSTGVLPGPGGHSWSLPSSCPAERSPVRRSEAQHYSPGPRPDIKLLQCIIYGHIGIKANIT